MDPTANKSTRVAPSPAQIALAVLIAAGLCLPTAAEEDASATEEDASDDPVKTITVVATRTERSLDEVAATVAVKTAEEIEAEVVRNIADLVRFEPGVTVAGTGSRFGLTGFKIRGIGGNRVLTLVDGVRVPDEFSFGPFLSARRDFVDIHSLERFEVARGPISSLYGSDALGGVVAFTTKGPRDQLREGRPFAGTLKAGYSGADSSSVGTVTLAGEAGAVAGMLIHTRRAGSETDNAGAVGGTGATRERPDPQDVDLNNLTAKVEFSPADAHTFTLGLEKYANETATRVLSDYGSVVFGTTVDSRDADDSRDRDGWSLTYRFDGSTPIADRVAATVYRQRSVTGQTTREQRTTPSRARATKAVAVRRRLSPQPKPPYHSRRDFAVDAAKSRRSDRQSRLRVSNYEQEIEGGWIQLDRRFALGESSHTVSYGADFAVTESASVRDGGTFDSTGAPLREFSPLPTRDFPLTEVTQFAIFLQDEIGLLDDRLLLSPGVRFDQFDADAVADAIYLSGNPGSPTPSDYEDSQVTAKLGALYSFSDSVSAYARFSQGFRAPPYDDVNVGFTNFLGGYKTIANPELESERSNGVEVGARLVVGDLNARVAYFRNRYENFIEAFAIAQQFLPAGGRDPADGLLTFQSVNRESVEIDGFEVGGGLELDNGLSARFALAYASGRDRASDEPLNSIDPLSAVLGLGYCTPEDRWGAEVVWTLSSGKDEGDIDESNPRLASSGYGIVDVLTHVNLGERVRLNAGLFNVTDKTYIRWADTVSIGGDAPARFTQPGFNAGLTLRVEL